MKSSRSQLHNLDINSRREKVFPTLTPDEIELFSKGGLSESQADLFIENTVGVLAVPIGIAANFIINGEETYIPLAIEEPSVIAAASSAAKLCRSTGGFQVTCEDSITTCEILATNGEVDTHNYLNVNNKNIITMLNELDPVLLKISGGIHSIISEDVENFIKISIHMRTADAMGANAVNTAGEALSQFLSQNTGLKVHGSIITNAFPKRTTMVTVTYNLAELESFRPGFLNNFITINKWAMIDPHRAVTHNKGIMNGVIGVLNAFGNDTRATEAAAHHRACENGKYMPLSGWKVENNQLIGSLKIPIAGAIIGGMTSHHPLVRILIDKFELKSSSDLCKLAGAAGLAANFSAIMAIATEGIQKGHMSLHSRKS